MLDIEHGIELRFRDLVSIDQQKVWVFHSLVIFTTFIYLFIISIIDSADIEIIMTYTVHGYK